MTYSLDLQQKVLQYIDKTGNISKASNVAQMSRNTIYQWLKLQKKTGSLNHQARGTQLRKVDRKKLKEYLDKHLDAYLTEITDIFIVIQQLFTMP